MISDEALEEVQKSWSYFEQEIRRTIKYLEEKPWRLHPEFRLIRRQLRDRTLTPTTLKIRLERINREPVPD